MEKPDRKPLGNRIDAGRWDQLDQIAEQSGRNKGRILESAIEAYGALPPQIQDIIARQDHPDRALVLDCLSALAIRRPVPEAGSE